MVLISVDLEGLSGPPTQDSMNDWADEHGITHPIVDDGNQTQMPYVTLGYPTYVVIDRTMTIVNADLWPFDANYIIGLL